MKRKQHQHYGKITILSYFASFLQLFTIFSHFCRTSNLHKNLTKGPRDASDTALESPWCVLSIPLNYLSDLLN